MSQSGEDQDGGGCCCFGWTKKKKGQKQPASQKPDVKNIDVKPPPTTTKPDPETKPNNPPPSFITQVERGQKGPPVTKISLQQVRPDPGVNSPRTGEIIQTDGKKNGDEQVPWRPDALLPPQRPNKKGMKCLILDLDESLVHSSFKEVPVYDFLIPVEIEGVTYQVYVAKRPGVDEFMKKMGECYEIVVFTASLAKYADPVLDLLDIHKVVDWRLFRESCTCIKNTYVKDMGRVGRPLKSVMIMDNSPHSYSFNPENAIPCESWFDDYDDTELLEFIPVLQEIALPSVENVIVELERRKMNGVARLLESMDSSSAESDSNSSAYSIESSSGSSSE